MKLYKRVDDMPWREFDETPGAICGAFENQATNLFDEDAERANTYCECALVPAPQAERDAALGRAVRAEVERQLDATQINLVRRSDDLRIGCYSAAEDAATLYDAIAAWMENSQKGDKNVDQS